MSLVVRCIDPMDIEGLYRDVKAAMAVLYGVGQRDTARADAFLREVQEKPECIWMGLTYIPQAENSDESLLLATMVKHALGRAIDALDGADKQSVFQKVRDILSPRACAQNERKRDCVCAHACVMQQ